MRLFYKGTQLGLREKKDLGPREKKDAESGELLYEVANPNLLEVLVKGNPSFLAKSNYGVNSELNEIEQLKQEKNAYLEIIRCFQDNRPISKKINKIESFCFFTTRHMKEEAAITVRSLRLFHQEPIYITCDQESHDFLSALKIKDLFFEIITSDYLNNIKEKFKGLYEGITSFHKVDCIYAKIDSINFPLRHHENTFFLDSDIIILDNLQEKDMCEIMLSPHYYSLIDRADVVGLFNAGYLFCANKNFPNYWNNLYASGESKFYEQHCMHKIPKNFETGIFDKSHNIGFWRDLSSSALHELKVDLPKKIKSFHFHTSPKFDFKGSVYAETKNSEIKEIALEYIKTHVPQVYEIMKSYL